MTAQKQCMFNVLPPEGNGLSVLCETITVTKCFYAKSGHRNAQQRHFYFISPSPFTVFTGSCNVRKRSWPETVVTVVFIYYHEYLCRHHCCLKLDFKLKKKSPGQINFEVTCTFFSSWAPFSGRWMYEISCVSWLSWLNTVGAFWTWFINTSTRAGRSKLQLGGRIWPIRLYNLAHPTCPNLY